MWEGGLPPIAVCQSLKCLLIRRYREQAPSHNGIPAGLEIEAQQKARLIIDQPGFFYSA